MCAADLHVLTLVKTTDVGLLLGRLGRASSRPLMFVHAFNLRQALMFSEVFKEGEPCQTSLPNPSERYFKVSNVLLPMLFPLNA